ncbi:hypothetical protein LINGRAHAP2_LOCUS6647 [Linum grandiflorum]
MIMMFCCLTGLLRRLDCTFCCILTVQILLKLSVLCNMRRVELVTATWLPWDEFVRLVCYNFYGERFPLPDSNRY